MGRKVILQFSYEETENTISAELSFDDQSNVIIV